MLTSLIRCIKDSTNIFLVQTMFWELLHQQYFLQSSCLVFIVLNTVWPLPTLHTLILKEIDVTINNCSMKINICWTEGYTYPYVTNLQHLFKINFLSKQNIHFFFYTCKLANHICLVLCLERKIWSFWKHMHSMNIISNRQLLWIQSYWCLIWYRCIV